MVIHIVFEMQQNWSCFVAKKLAFTGTKHRTKYSKKVIQKPYFKRVNPKICVNSKQRSKIRK